MCGLSGRFGADSGRLAGQLRLDEACAKLRAQWGIDYLLLARFDGRWMITHVLWQGPHEADAVPR